MVVFGASIFGFVICIRNGLQVLSIADLVAFASPPGLFLGRCANFINNELEGTHFSFMGCDLPRAKRKTALNILVVRATPYPTL